MSETEALALLREIRDLLAAQHDDDTVDESGTNDESATYECEDCGERFDDSGALGGHARWCGRDTIDVDKMTRRVAINVLSVVDSLPAEQVTKAMADPWINVGADGAMHKLVDADYLDYQEVGGNGGGKPTRAYSLTDKGRRLLDANTEDAE